MFETLQMAPPDAILGLTEAFKADTNPNKINLGVGVYKDASGTTPVLSSVKKAEAVLLEVEDSKGYLGIDGLAEYGARVRELMFGADHDIVVSNRAVTLQTPGGTGGLRVAAEFVASQFPNSSIWVSTPTWANHPAIFKAAGLTVEQYPYINAERTGLDIDAMLEKLRQVPTGDVIVLHGCCHNPSGIDPTKAEWEKIADVVRERGLLPLVDFAYQGFGDGLCEDAAGLHILAGKCNELLVCSSFSKNFGLYGERVGALSIVAGDEHAAAAALSHAKRCVRANYSNPPKHGALIVNQILSDATLRAEWEEELAAMRTRINSMRQQFAGAMKQSAPDHDFSFITRQRGMFSFSGLSPLQVDELRNEHSIYIVGSGRINVAGMTENNMPQLCRAIASVL